MRMTIPTLDEVLAAFDPLVPQSTDIGSPSPMFPLRKSEGPPPAASADADAAVARGGGSDLASAACTPPESDHQIPPQTTPFKRTLLGYEKGSGTAAGAALLPEDDDPNLDPAEAKRMKRMRRNRESAAMSRERKKAYIEELESKLAQLSQLAASLRSENEALRAGRAPLEGSASAPALPPVPAPLPASAPPPSLAPPIKAGKPAMGLEAAMLMPSLQSSDNDSESEASATSFEAVTSLEFASLDVFSQEPPCGLSLPAEPASLFRDATVSF